MKEEFVGMWVLGIVSQYIVRLHRVTKNTTETSSWKKDLIFFRSYFQLLVSVVFLAEVSRGYFLSTLDVKRLLMKK